MASESTENKRWIISALAVVPVLAVMGEHVIAVSIGCVWAIVLVIIVYISMEMKEENTNLKKELRVLKDENKGKD